MKNYRSKKTCLQFSYFHISIFHGFDPIAEPQGNWFKDGLRAGGMKHRIYHTAWQKTRGTMESYGSKINRWPALSHGLTALLQQCGSLWLPRVLNEQSVQCPVGCCFTEVCRVDMKRTTLLLGTCLQWLVVCSWSKERLS